MTICLPILLFYGTLFAQGSGSAITNQSWANCGTSTTLSFTESFTIEAWIYPLSSDLQSGGEHAIIDRRWSGGGYELRINNQKLRFIARESNGTEHSFDADGLVANKWQHIVAVMEKTGDNRVVKIYIDGISKTTSGSSVYSIGTSTATGFYIGSSKLVDNFYLNGRIDEVRAWSKALTTSEIQNNMCVKLSGSNSNLEGYWRFDEGEGSSVADDSPNTNTGSVSGTWVTSGVPLGDASTYDYSTPTSVNLASGYGDDVTVGTIANSPDGIQIYRVDSTPNVTTPPSGLDQLSQSHYFGVFVVGGSSPTYTLTYNYDGHPGISNENNLELASRSNNAATSWTDLDATLDTGANTLTKTDQTGTEYILASTGGNSLPVILSTFTVQYLNNTPTLYWVTQSETDNIGWYIYRNNEKDFENAERITKELINGYGTTTEQHCYLYKDNDLIVHSGDIYWYWIQNIDFGGQINTYDPHKLVIPNIEPENYEQEIPIEYGLHQNTPNPFNPDGNYVTISFNLHKTSKVELKIYNIKGALVKNLYNGYSSSENLKWDGKDGNGNAVKDGIYLYQLNVNGKPYKTNKLIVLH